MEEKALVYRLRLLNPLGLVAFKMGRLPAGLAPTHSTRCRLLRAFGPFDALSLALGDALPHAARVTWPVRGASSRGPVSRAHSTRCRLLRAYDPFDALSLAQGMRIRRVCVEWPAMSKR